MQELSEGEGEAGQYSPGATSALTQIVPYSASLYTVFHSVIYNSVLLMNNFYINSRIRPNRTKNLKPGKMSGNGQIPDPQYCPVLFLFFAVKNIILTLRFFEHFLPGISAG